MEMVTEGLEKTLHHLETFCSLHELEQSLPHVHSSLSPAALCLTNRWVISPLVRTFPL